MARGPVTGEAGRLRVARLAPVPANGRSANESRRHAAGNKNVGEGSPTYALPAAPNSFITLSP